MLLSIIIPTFNSGKTLEACLESIANQTIMDFEVLIMDGVSSDSTLVISEKYRSKLPTLSVISEPDKGIYDAMNKGISLAQGEWLYFLGSDDCLFESNTLEQVFATKKIDSLKVIYGNVLFKHSKIRYDGKFSFFKLNDKNICHQAIFYRKSVFEKLGNYEIKYKGLADWVLNIRWFTSELSYSYIDLTVAIYNEDGYCFNNPDTEFIKDQQRIKSDNFPYWVNLNLKLRNVRGLARIANYIFRKLY